MRVQFSSRQLLIVTSLVLFFWAGFFCLRKLTGINPSSESVWVVGEKVEAIWQDDKWRHTTGLYLPATQLTSTNWNGDAGIKVHQPLLTIAYENYFGKEVYRANLYLDGHRTDDWLHYLIQPMRTGGGLVDGGTTVLCTHSPENSSIKVVAIQYLNSQQRAKRLELVFDRVGDTFIQRTVTEQRVADGVGE